MKETVAGLDYAISLGYRLSDSVLSTVGESPSLIYKHHYKTVNWILDQAAEKLAGLIQGKGYRSLAIPASQITDWDRQLGQFDHRTAAQACGLGWIGRSGLLVNPKFGARVRLTTVLTDMPLVTDEPVEGDCGECEKCISACPAGAITREGFDRGKCIEQLKGFAAIQGIGVLICGICVRACDGI
jgi:epoxyqueuosine reductase QueG